MSFLSAFKNLIPLNAFYSLKNVRKKNLKIDGFSEKPKILYLDAPDYGNLGDQAIALAINKFAEEYFEDFDFYELSYAEYPSYEKFLLENTTEKDIVFLTGGGNMGNHYRLYEAVRRRIIRKFTKNLITVFPQTIDYSNNIFGRLSIKKSNKIYSKHPNLILCAREQSSFEKMKSLYCQNHVLSCPDIVLSLNHTIDDSKRDCFSVCLRNDMEKALNDSDHKKIISYVSQQGDVKEITTSYSGKIDKTNREQIIMERFNEFAKSKLIITDRLHGMIFSAITNTPCIAFDNLNKKVSGVFKHIENKNYICVLNDISLLESTFYYLLTLENISFNKCNVSLIAEKIREIYYGKN